MLNPTVCGYRKYTAKCLGQNTSLHPFFSCKAWLLFIQYIYTAAFPKAMTCFAVVFQQHIIILYAIYMHFTLYQTNQPHFRTKIISTFAHPSKASKAHQHENKRMFCLAAIIKEVYGLFIRILTFGFPQSSILVKQKIENFSCNGTVFFLSLRTDNLIFLLDINYWYLECNKAVLTIYVVIF